MKEPVCVFCGGDGKAFRPEDRESGKKCSACGGTGIQKPIEVGPFWPNANKRRTVDTSRATMDT